MRRLPMSPPDYLKPEFLTQQWAAFWGAWLFMLPTILGACWLGWFLNGTRSAGKINGLEGEKGVLERQLKADISLLEQRLKFGEEVRAASNKTNDEIDELKKRFDAIEVAVTKSDYASLSESVVEIKESIGKVSAANNAVTVKLNATNAQDVASLKVTAGEVTPVITSGGDTTSLDFGRYGVLNKIDYETLEKLQSMSKKFDPETLEKLQSVGKQFSPETLEHFKRLGKPFINIDPTKKKR
jgi:hypothetical protein